MSQDRGPAAASLYACADIVGYRRLSARLQAESQDVLARFLDASLAEAGTRPGAVAAQDQGGARLLKFPAQADIGRVLAVMPRSLHDRLRDRNQDLAVQARIRVRLAFAMGVSIQGRPGLVGDAPAAVVRLANAKVFRDAMSAVPQCECGVIMDGFLYGQYVCQDFRPDMSAAEYLQVRVIDLAQGFAADAWLRLPGCPPQALRSKLG
jgi:hypothetical protein